MKTKNIIAIISIIFTLISCSAESDILNEMPSNNTRVSGVETTISCTINNVKTKGEAVGDDQAINNVVYFLLDETGNVLGYRKAQGASFQTKNQTGLSVLAIVNAETDVTGLVSKNAIMSQVLNGEDLKALVKVGESKVEFSEDGKSGLAQITVKQVAARIDLSNLNLTIKDADVVKLERVVLKNQNIAGMVNGTVVAFEDPAPAVEILKGMKLENGDNEGVTCHFYSFANNSEKATALILCFDIDGKKVNKEVTIKDSTNGTAKVISGANHQLYITATIQGENVEPVVSFTVAEWKKSQIDVDMNE